MMFNIAKVLADIEADSDQNIDLLVDLLKIKSISTIPDYADECYQAAGWLKAFLDSFGMDAIIYESEGHPIVFSDYQTSRPEAKTILFYGHYDVQPVDPVSLWDSDPFDPVLSSIDNEPCIIARGASDDKGQLLTFLIALKYIKNEVGELPFSLKIILEGEEECGSKTLPIFLEDYKDKLSADIAYVCDTGMWDKDTPAITRSLRGLLSEEFKIIGPDRDLHSGEFGGVAWNPIRIITKILSDVYDDEGKVTIPNFYDGVNEVNENIINSWKKLTFNETEYLNKIGQKSSSGETGRSIFEKTWSRPTFEINGIFGGYTDEGTKTVIPSEANAKLTCRLVGNQDPEKILENIHKYIKSSLPDGVQVIFDGADHCRSI